MTRIHPSSLLRLALSGDALASAAMGLLLAIGGTLLAPYLGLPVALMRGAGLMLLPYAVVVGLLATRRELPSVSIWAIVVINVLWTLESVVLVTLGDVQPTALGYAFVLAQAAAVLAFAVLQVLGLRRSAKVLPNPMSAIA